MDFDVVVIGGGPAGIATAMWAEELGLTSIILERSSRLGGQLWQIHNAIKNYPGNSAKNGEELLENFLASAVNYNVQSILNIGVAGVDLYNKRVMLSDGRCINFRALVFATGVSRRKLGVAGEERFVDRGIISSGSRQRNDVNGKRVVIVGGGDAAVENAVILSDYARLVTLIYRGERLKAREEFVRAITEKPNVKILLNSVVTEFVGQDSLSGVLVRHISHLEPSFNEVEAALVRVGVAPNSDIVPQQVVRDKNGYIEIDRHGATNVQGIYAVGDVANPIAPTIATAVGNAATAVKFIYSNIRENMDIFQKSE